jgi:hypothetical protein
MLDTVGDLVSGLVELVSLGVFALARSMFRWEASVARPAWVRVVAIGLILAACAALFGIIVTLFVTTFYILLAVAAIGAVIALLGLG